MPKIVCGSGIYTYWSWDGYAVSGKSIRHIESYLRVGTTFDIFKPSRIYVQILDTAYCESPYGVLNIISIRLIIES